MNQNLNTETKLCKHCKSEINKLATICPHCKGKNPIRTKRHKIAFVLTVLIIIVFMGQVSTALENAPVSTAPVPVQKTQAEIDAWNKTPAGKLCAKHPTWKEDDCKDLIEKKIWVGMHYDMLVYLYGKPNHINPSNYGGGMRYQYCWTDYTPGCYYDKNDDGIIDSFN